LEKTESAAGEPNCSSLYLFRINELIWHLFFQDVGTLAWLLKELVILAELFRKISFVEINFDKFFRCRVAIVVKSASITKN